MENVILNCEVVTPLFISGAEKGRAELRPASIKGGFKILVVHPAYLQGIEICNFFLLFFS